MSTEEWERRQTQDISLVNVCWPEQLTEDLDTTHELLIKEQNHTFEKEK